MQSNSFFSKRSLQYEFSHLLMIVVIEVQSMCKLDALSYSVNVLYMYVMKKDNRNRISNRFCFILNFIKY